MPDQETHELVDKLVFGKAFPEVHKATDEPYARLGKLHRIERHDPLYGLSTGQPLVHLLHVLVDWSPLTLPPVEQAFKDVAQKLVLGRP